MQVVLEEAHESYEKELIVELQSDNFEQMESNVERINLWIQNWIENQNN